MAVVLDPNEVRPFWLEADAKIPLATRPTFECVAGNRRIRKQHATLLDKAASLRAEQNRLKDAGKIDEAGKVETEFWKTIEEALFLGVVGWRNMGRPFEKSIDVFSEILEDDKDLIELARDWPMAGKLTEDDLKNSQSPRPDGAEKSAPTAVAENAPPTPTTA